VSDTDETRLEMFLIGSPSWTCGESRGARLSGFHLHVYDSHLGVHNDFCLRLQHHNHLLHLEDGVRSSLQEESSGTDRNPDRLRPAGSDIRAENSFAVQYLAGSNPCERHFNAFEILTVESSS
jgi:hypothetical protein